MRRAHIAFVLTACAALAAPAALRAQTAGTPPQPPPSAVGDQPADATPSTSTRRIVVDLGLRGTSVDGDEGRFERYRDIGSGLFIEHAEYADERNGWYFRGLARNAGRLDQRYVGQIERPGRLELLAEFDAIPLWYTSLARSPYTDVDGASVLLPDEVQLAGQASANPFETVAAFAEPAALRSRRHTGRLRLTLLPRPDLGLHVNFVRTRQTGTRPWFGPFGFASTIQLPRPIDTATTDFGTSAEWTRDRGTVRVAYDGSWFGNDIPFLVWDNPARATDTATAPAQGRMSLPPDSSAHTISAAGSLRLPGRSRVSGHVATGTWTQDEELLPHTINAALAPIPLERQTADASVRRVSATLRVTSRPLDRLHMAARYRFYDFDNRTPHFSVLTSVRADSAVVTRTEPLESEPFSHARNQLDVDASWSVWRRTSLNVGYQLNRVERAFRVYEHTTEHGVSAGIDTTALPWLVLRAGVERAARQGSGVDEEVLLHVGEQPSLRHFDLAERTRTQVRVTTQILPLDTVGITASLSAGQDDFRELYFGLLDQDLLLATIGVDVTPREGLELSAAYGAERYSSAQRSRQANPGPQFADPSRDWMVDAEEDVHYWRADATLSRLPGSTSLRVSFSSNEADATYVYALPPGSTLAPPVQLTPISRSWQSLVADGRYHLTQRLAVGLLYWYDRFRSTDFGMDPSLVDRLSLPGGLVIGYGLHPYATHSAWARVIYHF